MQANLPYRAGGANAPGLPFPRANMGLYIALTILTALLALAIPFPALGNGSLRDAWRNFRDGGMFMYLLLLASVVLPIALAVLGSFSVRGRKIPLAALGAIAILPCFVGVFGSLIGTSQTYAAIAGEGVDPEQKLRIAIDGTGEASQALVFAALVSAVALAIVACATAGVVASIDRARVGKPAGLAWVVALAISLGWIAVAIGVAVMKRALGNVAFASALLGSFVVLVLALVASRAASALPGYEDAKESKRVAGALLIAAISSALALYLFDRAAALSSLAHAFTVTPQESVGASQRARILAEAFDRFDTYNHVAMIHGIGAFASFVPALVVSSKRGTHPFNGHSIATFACAIVAFACFLVVPARDRWRLSLVASFEKNASSDLALPHVSALAETQDPFSRSPLKLRKGADTTKGSGDFSDDYTPDIFVAADKDATVDDLQSRFFSQQKWQTRTVKFVVVMPGDSRLLAPEIDPLAYELVGSSHPVVSMSFGFSPRIVHAPSVALLSDSIQVRTRGITPIVVPRGDDLEERIRGLLGHPDGNSVIEIYVTPTTTVQELVTVRAAISTEAKVNVSPAGPELLAKNPVIQDLRLPAEMNGSIDPKPAPPSKAR